MKKAIQFGAGNIGRGFIGSLLSGSGYEVIFADISQIIIPQLQNRKSYTIEIVGEESREMEVAPVDGCYSDSDDLLKAVAEAEVITTAVGPKVLEKIAPRIALGLEERRRQGNESPLNIIACENMLHASSVLKRQVEDAVDDETKAFMAGRVGFPDCAVDRIIPPMEESQDPLLVRVEEFSEWIVDRGGFCGEIPEIEGMQLTDTLDAFIERKLFTLNTGHAIAAYLGMLHGYDTIAASVADPHVLSVVRGAMEESGEVLIRRYGLNREEHHAYIGKILKRFRNPWLKDDVRRVGREPLRKLGPDDRLIKPLRGTVEYGLPNKNLVVGIAAALYYRSENDSQAQHLRELLEVADVNAVIPEITSIKDEEILGAIESAYEDRGVQDLIRNYVREWTRIVSMQEAKANFSELVDEAMSGKEVIVVRSGKPMVRLTPVIPPRKAV